MKSRCPECGMRYSPNGGGHCRGGRYGGCCQTFANDQTADAHRVGAMNRDEEGRLDRRTGLPLGPRRCLTPAEMGTKGWRLTDRGWTKFPPKPDRLWLSSAGAPDVSTADPSNDPGPAGSGVLDITSG